MLNIPIALMCHSNRKLKKASNELADKMGALRLDELSPSKNKNSTEQLMQLENIFSFPTADSSTFPKNHCQDFIQQIQHLPPGKIFNTFWISVECVWFMCDSIETWFVPVRNAKWEVLARFLKLVIEFWSSMLFFLLV